MQTLFWVSVSVGGLLGNQSDPPPNGSPLPQKICRLDQFTGVGGLLEPKGNFHMQRQPLKISGRLGPSGLAGVLPWSIWLRKRMLDWGPQALMRQEAY